MLYHLIKYLSLHFDIPGAGMFLSLSFRAAMGIILALVIGMIFGKRIIRMLQRRQIGVDQQKIKGVHNIYNAMAASIAALSAGVPPESICQTLRTFTGVEHRLEPCGEYGGVL